MIPQWDSSLAGNHGDRVDSSKFKKVDGPIDLIIFQGWMLGYPKITEHDLSNKESINLSLSHGWSNEYFGQYLEVNEKLDEYKQQWQSMIDAAIFMTVPDSDMIYKWREEDDKPHYSSRFRPFYDINL